MCSNQGKKQFKVSKGQGRLSEASGYQTRQLANGELHVRSTFLLHVERKTKKEEMYV
jgi:hypothetical protein